MFYERCGVLRVSKIYKIQKQCQTKREHMETYIFYVKYCSLRQIGFLAKYTQIMLDFLSNVTPNKFKYLTSLTVIIV